MSVMAKIMIDLVMCTGCGTCIDICPEGVFGIKETDKRKTSEILDEAKCFVCRACEVRCP